MTLTYHDPSCEIHQGHVLDVLAEMPSESVDCCITSPPYWSLRKYSGDQNLIWGGKEGCQHEWSEIITLETNMQGGQDSQKQNTVRGSHATEYSNRQRVTNVCSLCGAWRGALGLEPTPELYLAHLVEIFRAVRRVLRPWGTCFINLGDTYASGGIHSSQSRPGPNVISYGNDGKGLKCYLPDDCVCPYQHDERPDGTPFHRHHNKHTDQIASQVLPPPVLRVHDTVPHDSVPASFPVLPDGAQASTNLESFELSQGECLQAGKPSSSPCTQDSFAADGQVSSHTARGHDKLDRENLCGPNGVCHTSDKVSCFSCRYSSILSPKNQIGLKPLDLCGIPESLVLALRADGWYWRSTIIWAKTNPMPESVAGWRWERHKVKVKSRGKGKSDREIILNRQDRNGGQAVDPAIWQDCPGCPVCQPNDGLVLRKGSWRPTSSFEYVFMLAKSKDYFCDGEAVREPHIRLWDESNAGSFAHPVSGELHGVTGYTHSGKYPLPNPAGRNLRDVWTINTQPFPGAHFATFPEDLVTKPILASTSDKGNCPKCGMPWVRVVTPSPIYETLLHGKGFSSHSLERGKGDVKHENYPSVTADYITLSWRASCSCGIAETVPAVVLDPFCGSGTTLAVAKRLGRRAIGIDLSGDYCQMAQRRVERETVPFKEP